MFRGFRKPANKAADLLARLESSDWMARWGRGGANNLRFVSDWEEAVRFIGQSSGAMQELQGQYTARLYSISPRSHKRWNGLVDQFKPVVEALIDSKLTPMAREYSLDELRLVRARVAWILLHALIEAELFDVMQTNQFGELAEHIVSGHLPCGWTNDQNLVLY